MIYRAPQEPDFMAMNALDLALLLAEDPAFAEQTERERQRRVRTSLPALRFLARTEHSFMAIDSQSGVVHGFILAQSIWSGDKAIVWVVCLRVAPTAPAECLPGLLHACVKSAYDSAVYEVHLAAPPALWPYAEREGFVIDETRHLVRYLGKPA
jgi:hypothetical protein